MAAFLWRDTEVNAKFFKEKEAVWRPGTKFTPANPRNRSRIPKIAVILAGFPKGKNNPATGPSSNIA